ncbi:MAG: hydantoinase [Alphaproteobacteria bacterium]|nr:MAG: hydantoinase [Alphaproteobacteria bacterium]
MNGLELSVDVGGTFTDFIFCHDDGRTEFLKSTTTPDDISQGIFLGIEKAAGQRGLSAADLVARCRRFSLGTTVATNAILQGRTARTALICTQGHEHVLLIREGHKTNIHDLRVDYPEPHIPQPLTFPVRERVLDDGEVLVPLDEEDLRRVIGRLAGTGVEAVAVAYLWSISNPAHELRTAEVLAELLPGVPVTLSHSVSPTLREYRRTSTAALDASLKPVVRRNLKRMEDMLTSLGFRGALTVVTSGGGRVSIEEAIGAPVNLCLSGPSGAPVASNHICAREEGVGDSVITCDLGGTSFDVSISHNGESLHRRHGEIGGHIFAVPSTEILTIGAGGGSVAEIDSGGMIHVGRFSAGSFPGPACYQRGGTDATVTDAALVCGLLDARRFGDGSIVLSRERAVEAVKCNIADKLGLTVAAAARLVIGVVEQNMAGAIEEITIKRGLDPRDFTLVGGGSAAGLHMAAIARLLRVGRVLFPSSAGVLSAFGIATGDIKSYFGQSFMARSDDFDHEGVNGVLAALEARARRFLDGMGVAPQARELRFTAQGCYTDQVWTLTTSFPGPRVQGAGELADLVASFHRVHEERYRTRSQKERVEFREWGVEAVGRHEVSESIFAYRPPDTVRPSYRRTVLLSQGTQVDLPVHDRAALSEGETIAGPAIIEDDLTTILVTQSATARMTRFGNVLVEIDFDA